MHALGMGMPSNMPVNQAALVQKGESNLEGPWYQSVVPVNMLQTVGVAIVVDREVLPPHSFVLMANSEELGELLVCQSHLLGTKKVLHFPLTGVTSEDTKAALNFIYQHCIPGGTESDRARSIGYIEAIAFA